MLMSDKWIRKMCLEQKMIDPFVERQDGEGKISFGLSSYGYDIRLADEYKIFTNVYGTVVDPKNWDAKAFVDYKGPHCIVPPNSFALARSVEYFNIPRGYLAICLGKSTFARCGIIVNVTPLEPTWQGHLTIEISNTTPLPAKVYSGEGIAQLLFLQGNEVCEVAYADRKGKYQSQTGIVGPRILAKS